MPAEGSDLVVGLHENSRGIIGSGLHSFFTEHANPLPQLVIRCAEDVGTGASSMVAGSECLERHGRTEQDLALQGFAVLELGRDLQSLESCQKDAGSLRRRLRGTPEELLECFLGRRGSARFCEIPFDEPPSRRVRCENLRDLSRDVVESVKLIAGGRLSQLGCLLHETGNWDGRSAAPLQESDVEFWLPRLRAAELTAIVALGPATAEVELRCLGAEIAVVEIPDEPAAKVDGDAGTDAEDVVEDDDSDEVNKPPMRLASREVRAQPHHITLPPGRLLLVRSNCIWQTVAGDAGDFVVSWMFGSTPEVDWAILNKPLAQGMLTPGILQLQAWLNKRLEQRRARLQQSEVSEWRVMIPYVYKLKAPRAPTAAARLEVFSKGDIILGVTETVDGHLWLRTQTGQAAQGQPVTGYIALEAEGAVEPAVQPVTDFPFAWQTLSAQVSTGSCHQTVIRAASCKFATTHQVRLFWPPHVAGADFCVEVPLARWDHSPYFSEDRDDTSRIFCKHGAFMDGAELFDNKRFQISPAEVISMDPQQRMALECAEEVFFNMGLKREAIVRSTSGVYVGAGMHEWGATPNCARDPAADMYGCTGGSTAIHSNRISFNLGLMGPSITVLCEGASSLVTLERGFVSLSPQKSDNIRALSMGVSTMLIPSTWIFLSQNGVMWRGGPQGRCMSFSADAAGYVRGEGCGCVIQEVLGNEGSADSLGIMRSARSTTIGGASLHSPNGPAEQALVSETVSLAKLDSVSVDAVDANAEGRQLGDAIELAAISTILCPADGESSQLRPLPLMSCKASQAHCLEAAGICALLRILFSTHTCCHAAPIQHLYALNPIIDSASDFSDFHCHLPTELVKSRSRESIVGVKGHSIAGTIGMVLASISKQRPTEADAAPPALSLPFWPSGSVSLPSHALPDKGYELIGSWSGWEASIPMTRQSLSGRENVWSAPVPVEAGGFVSFQILLDGDPEKILHPGAVAAGPNTRVMGPHPRDQLGRSVSWCIAAGPSAQNTCHVELHISGSWRAVSWLRLKALEEGA